MKRKEHTRNQKRMYRIHKLEEKVHNQDLLIGSLQQKSRKLTHIIEELEKWLEEYIKEDIDKLSEYKKGYWRMAEMILDKLKQLQEEE